MIDFLSAFRYQTKPRGIRYLSILGLLIDTFNRLESFTELEFNHADDPEGSEGEPWWPNAEKRKHLKK